MSRSKVRIAGAMLMIAISPLARAQEHNPSATLMLSGGAIGIGVGYTWSSGALDFQGQIYPFSIDGLSLGDVGAAHIEGVGEVYNLQNLDQFAGHYLAAGVGAAVAGGGSTVTMQNKNGVVIHLHSTEQGLNFNLSASGLSVRLTS